MWHGVLSLITRVPEHDDSVISTDVKIILADVLHTTCNIAVLVVQSLLSTLLKSSMKESDWMFFTALRLPIRVRWNRWLSGSHRSLLRVGRSLGSAAPSLHTR